MRADRIVELRAALENGLLFGKPTMRELLNEVERLQTLTDRLAKMVVDEVADEDGERRMRLTFWLSAELLEVEFDALAALLVDMFRNLMETKVTELLAERRREEAE